MSGAVHGDGTHVGEIRCGRHQVVGERCVEHLRLPVVDEAIEKYPAQSLHQRSDRLAVHDLRIHGAPDILDRNIVDDLDRHGAGVDGHVAGMGAIAVGADCGGEAAFRLDTRKVRKRRALLAGADPSVRDSDLRIGVAEALRRRSTDCVEQILATVQHGRAAHHHGTGREAADTLAQMRGRAMANSHALERQAERIGGDLRERCLKSLPEHRGPDMDGHHTVVLDDEARALLAGSAAFHEWHGGKTMVAPVHQTALQRLLPRPADLAHGALERSVIIAGIELGLAFKRHQLAGSEGQLGLGNEILAAKRDGIEAEIARHHVKQPLAEEIRLEAPGRPHGAHGRLAGHVHVDGNGNVADAIRAGQKLRRFRRHHSPAGTDIGSHVAMDVTAQRKDDALAGGGDLEVAVHLARVVGGDEVLAAILDPLDRPADMTRCERNEEVLGIKFAADAKPSADIDFDQVDRVFGHRQHRREDATIEEGHFCGAEYDQPALVRVPLGDEAAGLQRHCGETMTVKALAAGVIRLGECRIGIAERYGVSYRAVAAALLEQQRPVLGRGMPVGERRQPLDVDVDRVEGVLGQRLSIGDDHRDRLADVADLVLGDHRLKIGTARQIGETKRDDRDARADLGRGDHAMHAFARARGARIESV